jgi:hypothetical protein
MVQVDTDLSSQDVADMVAAWDHAVTTAQRSLLAAGVYNWQLMYNSGTCAGPLVHQSSCASDLRSLCTTMTAVSHCVSWQRCYCVST